MTDKTIIVEFGVRRQRVKLTGRFISYVKLLQLISYHFNVKLDHSSPYILQIYDRRSNEYVSLTYNERQLIDVTKDIEQLHRFRIITRSTQSEKYHLLNDLRLTMKKLDNATKNIDKLQSLLGAINRNFDILNQLTDTRPLEFSPNENSSHTTYFVDPSIVKKHDELTDKNNFEQMLDEENFESVSYYDSTSIYNEPVLNIMNTRKQLSSKFDDSHIQTRIIPCKYAVRGNCHLGDKCLYLHDEACIQSAREWERRL